MAHAERATFQMASSEVHLDDAIAQLHLGLGLLTAPGVHLPFEYVRCCGHHEIPSS